MQILELVWGWDDLDRILILAIVDQVVQFWKMNGIDILCFFMKYVSVDVEINIIPIVMKLEPSISRSTKLKWLWTFSMDHIV